jgi:hypothetical protein
MLCASDSVLWCLQGQSLYSTDNRVFLTVQGDGNVVLYNTLAYSLYGANTAAAVIGSHTYLVGSPPYSLAMQNVRRQPFVHPWLHAPAMLFGMPAPDAAWCG